jgi:acetyltransferase-like isoleucine patch superfamily enzyme
MQNVYKTKVLPKWLKQTLSDILIFFGQSLPHPQLRILIWKLRGAKLNGVRYIGMNCLIGNHPWFLTIKQGAIISSGTRVLTEDASYEQVLGVAYSAETVIEENVHVGMNCIIFPGVTIGKNSIIGAGSLVMQSIPADSVAIGNPARVIMSTEMGALMMKKKLEQQSAAQK